MKMTALSSSALWKEEWLATNGLGGFASNSIAGGPTRKYHGLLVAALPAPYGRTVMLNYIADALILPDQREIPLSTLRVAHNDAPHDVPLTEFRLEEGFPVWHYEVEGIVLEKSLFLIHKQNTLHMSYRLLSAQQQLQIKWRPYLHFRTHEEPVNSPSEPDSYVVHVRGQHRYEIEHPHFPPLRLYNFQHPPFTIDSATIDNVFFELEYLRGYAFQGNLTSPGYYLTPLRQTEKVTFVASTEPWQSIQALTPQQALPIEVMRRRRLLKTAGEMTTSSTIAKLVLAADQFIITPNTRSEDMVRMQAGGEEVRTIIAGYPWFTDWGRDTMISLEGLTITTGRTREAHSILQTFSHYVKDGLIPNMFPDGEKEGLYHTADATLWYFHAIDRYIDVTGDKSILDLLMPMLQEIIDSHIRGTRFGIKVDDDGLLMQGQEGYQLTWMDAKVGDWVVTPRRGKAVEINALWYNALKLFEMWTGKTLTIAEQCYTSFNARFWYEPGQYLYDIVDGEQGDDAALRPNQLFAIALRHPILEQHRWSAVLTAVEKDLLTPVGLRTLSPAHPDFKPYYDGDLRARDAAYHQGTVWPWLLGPFIDVWLKVRPDDIAGARTILKGLKEHLNQNCRGSIEEIFDACDPYHARGCFAQAWSVAEFLRCSIKLNQKIPRP